MRKYVLISLVLSLVPLAGCFGGNPIACDFRATRNRCQERSGVQAANPPAYQATCETASGTYLDDGCPSEGIVAGCELSSEVVDWYYAPETVETITATCEGEGTVVFP